MRIIQEAAPDSHRDGIWEGGIDFPPNPNIVFNADIRYFFMNYGDQKVKDLNMNGYIISAGLTFYLW